MTAVMIDLETMSTAHDAAIVQIGACTLDGEKRFLCNVSLQSSTNAGLRVDGGTVEWWLTQSDEARASLRENRVSLVNALERFNVWVFNLRAPLTEIWSFPASFDLVILANAYRACAAKAPWGHRQPRCAHTLLSLCPTVERSIPECKHNALSDALAQAADVLACKAVLNG